MSENTTANEASKVNEQKSVTEMPEGALNEVNGGGLLPDIHESAYHVYYHSNCGGKIEAKFGLGAPRAAAYYQCSRCGEKHDLINEFDYYRSLRKPGGAHGH